MQPVKDGHAPYGKYRTYYKVVGKQADKHKLPLLVLNGGPGSSHDYLLDLRLLADSGRQVIFYDSVGCGRSDRPDDDRLWTVDFFVQEIDALRKELKLKDVHILGHSWGGMLAIEYLLTNPAGVHSVILASTMISIPLFLKEMAALRRKLPLKVQRTLKKHEKAGTTDSPEYQAAYQVFSKRHIFRQDDWPPHLLPPPQSFGTEVYHYMWGPSECAPTGTLQQWDRISRLHEITIPTLITSGKYDELTPHQAEMTAARIPNSRQVLFDDSAHMAHIEEPSRYITTVNTFLNDVDL